jgi:hypothetical protein
LPNVLPEKEDNKAKCENKGYRWRQMQAEQAGNVGRAYIHGLRILELSQDYHWSKPNKSPTVISTASI